VAKRNKNTPIPDELGDERQRPIPSKKNKKKWCRGKVNVLHKPEPMKTKFGWVFSPQWWELICTNCGKRLGYYWPIGETREPPSWVPEE
jgi:hypothetical protein